METNSPPPSRRRRRPTLACEPCRRKKIRCDRNAPCENCARSKSELCTYLEDEHPTERSGNGRAAPDRTKQARLATNNNNHNSSSHHRTGGIRKSPNAGANLTRHDLSSSAGRDLPLPYFSLPTPRSSFSRDPSHRKSPIINSDISQPINLDQEFLGVSKALETAPTSVSSPAYEENSGVQGIFSKTRFFGQSHWMNSVYQFNEVYEVIQKFESDETSDARVVYDKCKNLARAIKAREIIRQPLRTDFHDYIPPRKTADKLVQVYIRTFESVFRILHIPSFLRECNNYWASPSSSSHEFVIKLLLVMTIGMRFSPDHNDLVSFSSISSQWIHTAQSWLNSPFEKSRVNVSGIQIYCLLLLTRQVNGVEGDMIWISAGSLLRTAMHMGLHIDPSRLSGMSFFDQEIRKRLWATVLEIIVQSSMDTGGLPLVSIQDIDCEPPSNIDDEQMDEDSRTIAEPIPKSMEQYTRTSVQIALMKSLPVRLEIARFLNDFRSKFPYDKTLQLASRLSFICRANYLLFQSFHGELSHPSTFQVKLLDLLTYRFLLALHHPFAMKAKTDPTLYFSRKVSLEVSLSLLSHPSAAPDDDYERLKLTGTGLFRDVAVQATSTICEELINQLEEEKSSFTPVSSSFSRRDLRKIVEEYVDLLDLRIKHGETNIRGHLLFSCLLAHIDALQTNHSIEQAISTALKKSLDNCHRILKTRADETGATTQLDAEVDAPGNGRHEDMAGVEGAQDWFVSDEMVSGTIPLGHTTLIAQIRID